MTVLVVDTDQRRQIPSEFLWVIQGPAKRAERALYIERAGRRRSVAPEKIGMLRAVISSRGRQIPMSRDMLLNGEIATGQYGD